MERGLPNLWFSGHPVFQLAKRILYLFSTASAVFENQIGHFEALLSYSCQIVGEDTFPWFSRLMHLLFYSMLRVNPFQSYRLVSLRCLVKIRKTVHSQLCCIGSVCLVLCLRFVCESFFLSQVRRHAGKCDLLPSGRLSSVNVLPTFSEVLLRETCSVLYGDIRQKRSIWCPANTGNGSNHGPIVQIHSPYY